MESNSPTKSTKQKVVDNLLQGYELATQLQLLLTTSGETTAAVDDLLAKILGSFNKTISVLDSFDLETSRNASCGDDSAAPLTCNGEDSGDSKKRLGSGKGKRGCYARKKRSQTWTLESRKIEDKHCWRKYGQKEILNATFPRSYFRCTHKATQGCKAMKQVQKLEHDSEMFQITYIGYHTCNTKTKTHDDHEIIMDSDTTWPTHDHVNVKSQEHENNNSSSITVVGPVRPVGPVGPVKPVKEEENNIDFSSGELSSVWRDILMFDETSSINSHQQVVDSMMFSSNNYAFCDNNNNNNNDHFSSFFDHYCV